MSACPRFAVAGAAASGAHALATAPAVASGCRAGDDGDWLIAELQAEIARLEQLAERDRAALEPRPDDQRQLGDGFALESRLESIDQLRSNLARINTGEVLTYPFGDEDPFGVGRPFECVNPLPDTTRRRPVSR